MQFFTFFFIPETKGIPIEEMDLVWTRHWFWKRYVPVSHHNMGVPMSDVKANKLENGANGTNGANEANGHRL